MTPIFSGDNVLVYAGQDTERADILAAARELLVAGGNHPLDVDDALVDRQGLVGRAHWGGVEVGFVGEQYPGAQAVTVVNLPKGMV